MTTTLARKRKRERRMKSLKVQSESSPLCFSTSSLSLSLCLSLPLLPGKSKRRWKFLEKHYFNRNSKVASCSFSPHPSTCGEISANGNSLLTNSDDVILAVGFESGVFGLWTLSHSSLSPPFILIHVLSMSTHPLTSAAVAPGGDWVSETDDVIF
jgi:hypothetical protein